MQFFLACYWAVFRHSLIPELCRGSTTTYSRWELVEQRNTQWIKRLIRTVSSITIWFLQRAKCTRKKNWRLALWFQITDRFCRPDFHILKFVYHECGVGWFWEVVCRYFVVINGIAVSSSGNLISRGDLGGFYYALRIYATFMSLSDSQKTGGGVADGALRPVLVWFHNLILRPTQSATKWGNQTCH